MSDAWDAVRSGIVTKLAASSGLASAGLRRASANLDDPLSMLPEVRVLQPAYTLLSQSGTSEEYLLDVPFEVVVNRPAGTRRSNPIAADIARAVQVEFQAGVKLGLSLGLVSIVDARVLSMEPGLSEYDDRAPDDTPLYDGYRGVIQVQVFESVSRTF